MAFGISDHLLKLLIPPHILCQNLCQIVHLGQARYPASYEWSEQGKCKAMLR